MSLDNNTVYKGTSEKFKTLTNPQSITKVSIKTTFSSADPEKGIYQDLKFLITDSTGGKETLMSVTADNPKPIVSQRVLFILIRIILVGVYAYQRLTQIFTFSHVSINFCYKSGNNAISIASLFFLFEVGVGTGLILITLADYLGFAIWIRVFCAMNANDNRKNELRPYIKKYAVVYGGGFLALLFLSAIFYNYFPYIFFLPYLFWVIDKLTSNDCHSPSYFLLAEISRTMIIFIDFYLPFTWTGMDSSLIMVLNIHRCLYFLGFALIVFPVLVFVIDYEPRYKKSHNLAIDLEAKFSEKKYLRLPKVFFEQNERFDIQRVIDGGEQPTVVISDTKIQCFNLDVYSGIDRYLVSNFTVEYILSRGLWTTMKNDVLKMGWRYERQFGKLFSLGFDLSYGLRIVPVQMGASFHRDHFVCLFYRNRAMIYYPKTRRVIKTITLNTVLDDLDWASNPLLISTFVLLTPKGFSFLSLKIFDRKTVMNQEEDTRIVRLDNEPLLRYTLLDSGDPESVDLKLPMSRYSSAMSQHVIVSIANYDNLISICFKITDKYSVLVYRLSEVAEELGGDRLTMNTAGQETQSTRTGLNDENGNRVNDEGPEGYKRIELLNEVDRRILRRERVYHIFFFNDQLLSVVLDHRIVFYNVYFESCYIFTIHEFRRIQGFQRVFEYERYSQKLKFKFYDKDESGKILEGFKTGHVDLSKIEHLIKDYQKKEGVVKTEQWNVRDDEVMIVSYDTTKKNKRKELESGGSGLDDGPGRELETRLIKSDNEDDDEEEE